MNQFSNLHKNIYLSGGKDIILIERKKCGNSHHYALPDFYYQEVVTNVAKTIITS